MKRIEVTDELLYQYMPIADELELDALEAEIADEEIVLSKKFEKKMKRLMWKEEHKWVAGLGKFMARAAVVFLGIIGVSLAVTMSVDAYRSKFFQTVQEIWEDSVIHTYDVGEEGQEFVPHEPSYIPEGYEEVKRIETDVSVYVEHMDANGNYICWDQRAVYDEDWRITNTGYKEQFTKKIQDKILVVSVYDDGTTQVYWEAEKYIYIINSNELKLEEIEKILTSIQ